MAADESDPVTLPPFTDIEVGLHKHPFTNTRNTQWLIWKWEQTQAAVERSERGSVPVIDEVQIELNSETYIFTFRLGEIII